MKRKFEELRENLDEFVQQDEYPLLVVGCLSEELAYVVTFLQGLEEKHPPHYFVVFPEPFESGPAYLDGVVRNIEAQVAGANEQRAERGEAPFPPVPAELSDGRRSPEERLVGVLDYLRGLLPPSEVQGEVEETVEHHIVAGFLPLSCTDYLGYCRLMNHLTTNPQVQPSLERMRVVIYDDRSRNELVGFLRQRSAEHVLTFEVNLSTAALTDQLSKDAADPSLPVPERMNALMQLAALDYSYKRYADALEKYGVLFEFHERAGQPSMQALSLLGTGDTLFAAALPKPAKERLQQGLALAMENKALPVLVNLLLSIHGVCMALRQYDEAESYAESGTQVAAAVLNPFVYADFHALMGDAQLAQHKTAAALTSYKKCKDLCKMYDHFFRWKAVLEKEKTIYEAAEMRREYRDAEIQLGMVDRLEHQGGSAAAEPKGTPA